MTDKTALDSTNPAVTPIKPKRPTSPARAAASRANGAKSRGPKTLRGHYDPALNGSSHDFISQILLLPGESQAQFHRLCHGLHQDLRPANTTQRIFVEEIIASWWRKTRVWQMEKSHIAREMTTGCIPPDTRPSERAAQSVANITGRDRTLDLFLRYESRYERQIHRAIARLIQLKTLPPDFDVQNEGEPEPEPDQAPPAPLLMMPKPPGPKPESGAHRPPLGRPLCAVQPNEAHKNDDSSRQPAEKHSPAFSTNPRT